jgi:hypothetical protein
MPDTDDGKSTNKIRKTHNSKSQALINISAKYKYLFAILGLIGTCIILFATSRYGAGFSPDSVNYLSNARNLQAGVGIQNMIVYPPLYPILLASMGFIFGKDPISIAQIINAVIFGLIIFFTGVLFYQYLKSPFLYFLGPILVIVSIPLIPVFLMAWTEPLFVFFILLYIIILDSYLKKQTFGLLLLLSFCVILASLTRYIGIILIPIGFISTFLYSSNSLSVKKFRHSFLFLLISSIPIGIWIIKNNFLSGTLFGPRSLSTYTYYQNLASTFDSFLSWYLPRRISDSRPLLMILAMMIGFFIGIGFKDGWISDGLKFIKKSPISLLVLIYIGFLVLSSKTSFLQLIDNRYLSPVFIPINILLFSFIEKGLIYLRSSSHRTNLIILFCVSIGIWLIYPIRNTIIVIDNHYQNGSEYTSKSWHQSETIQYLINNRTLDSQCTIYTNSSDAVYLFTNLRVKSIPSKTSGAEDFADISSLRDSWPQENKACIVWFNQLTWRTDLFTPNELMSVTNVEHITQLNDGAIYFLSRK